ncbi:hypothetical protein ScPMuIL_006283, partial [Solemya velum]
MKRTKFSAQSEYEGVRIIIRAIRIMVQSYHHKSAQKKGATCTTMPVPPPGLDLSGIRTTTPTTSTPTIRTAPISTPIRSENMHGIQPQIARLIGQENELLSDDTEVDSDLDIDNMQQVVI